MKEKAISTFTLYALGLLSPVFHGMLARAQYITPNATPIANYQTDNTEGNGLSAFDINYDGWPDITATSANYGVYIYLNNQGVFEFNDALANIPGIVKSLNWVDYDNDADADILILRWEDWPLLLRNDGNWNFTDVTDNLNMPFYSSSIQSACWADYDNDGWLDVYFNNYYLHVEIPNWLFHNNGDGTFTEVAVTAGVEDGSNPTYQSTWIDYDLDGDQDLYVANDRVQGNQLYINRGDGTFDTDSTTHTNIAIDAMGVHWHDHDYDGDFDVYITNTQDGSPLMENNNGVFYNISEITGTSCPDHISWGVQWTDPDCDGRDELCVVHRDLNNITCWFERNEDLTYTLQSSSILSAIPYPSYCLVTADFNQDGREDLAQNTFAPNKVLVWLAQPSDNHSITISLHGCCSNYDAIGAIIKVHTAQNTQIKQITNGESFLGQCSQYEIFGLGQQTLIDSIEVTWPSGWRDVMHNVEADQNLSISEGITYVHNPDTIHVNRCFDQTVTISPGNYSTVTWMDGEVSNERIVQSDGIYTCAVPGPYQFDHYFYFVVTSYTPEINVQTTNNLCAGDSAGILHVNIAEPYLHFAWDSSPDSIPSLAHLPQGAYAFSVLFENNCYYIDTAYITAPPPIHAWVNSDTICAGTTVALSHGAYGGTAPITWLWNEINPQSSYEGQHSFSVVDYNGCTYEGEYTIDVFPVTHPEFDNPTVCAGESAYVEFFNDSAFTILWPDGTSDSLVAGIHTFYYIDSYGCKFDSVYVVSEFAAPAVEIILTDSLSTTNQHIYAAVVSGGTQPFDYIWNTGDSDSYTESSDSMLTCQVIDANECNAIATFQISSIDDYATRGITAFPNPCGDFIFVRNTKKASWQLFDSRGRLIRSNLSSDYTQSIDMSMLSTGIYILRSEIGQIRIVKSE